jgi:small GTP-binding protein
MGKEISKFSQKICLRTGYYKVLILGLEGSGKTTLFDRIKSNEVYIRTPTIGFNSEQIKQDGMMITLWDMGGHEKVMDLWDRYFDNTDLVILVIDSTDRESYDGLKNILKMIKDSMENIYVLILINKIDLTDSISTEEIVERVDLYKFGLKIAKVMRISTTRGDGMKEVKKTMSYVLKNITYNTNNNYTSVNTLNTSPNNTINNKLNNSIK